MFLLRKVLPFGGRTRPQRPRQMFRRLSFLQTMFTPPSQPLHLMVQSIENEKTDDQIRQSCKQQYQEIQKKIEIEKEKKKEQKEITREGGDEEQKEMQNDQLQEQQIITPIQYDFNKNSYIIAATKIQQYYKRTNKIRKQKKLIKNQKYRKHIIIELIQTEQAYVNDLQLIMDQIIQPLSKFLTEQDIFILFSNIKTIHQLNNQFLQEIKNKFEQCDSNKIGDIMLQYVAFFKIYFEYYNNYKKQLVHFEHLQETNQKFADFISSIPKKVQFRFLQYQDFIVKPVQRLPKYVLLLKDLLKHTETTHHDYDDLKKAFEQFSKVNDDNNQLLNKLQVNQALFDLQKLYGDKVQVIDPRRSYITQQDINILKQNNTHQVILYVMSDLLLIANKKTKKLYNVIHLSEATLKNLEDTEYFQNVYSLNTKINSITFIDDSKERKQANLKLFDELMKNKEYKIEVKVIGIEERSGLIKTAVVYIIEVKNMELVQKCYLTFKECFKIQEKLQKEIPLLNFLIRVPFESGHDSKVIDARKIQIENFVASIINNNPSQSVLDQFGLTSAIFDERARKSSRGHGAVSRRSFKASEGSFEEAQYPFPLRHSLSVSSNKKITITVNDQKIEVGANIKVLDLYPLVEKKYSINSTWDFKFLTYDNKIQRALEDDEFVSKIDEKNLDFRKFYYLSQEQEISEYLSDLNKLILIYNQLIHQLKKGELIYKFQDACLICALHLKEVSFENISKMLPTNILKSAKKDQWLLYVDIFYEQVKESSQNDILRRLLLICIMRQQNENIGRQVYQLWDEKREEIQLQISYKGAFLGNSEEVNQIQVQSGFVIMNEKKYWTLQGYQMKSVLDEYQQLAQNIEINNDQEEIKTQLKDMLVKLKYQSYETRRKR